MILPIYISEKDSRRLRALSQSSKLINDNDHRVNMQRLVSELERAHIVPESELPGDVIIMNSTAELEDIQTGDVFTYTLVFPEFSDPGQGRISIMAPMGIAMLGYRAGDEFEWQMPGGMMRLRVRRVLAPATALASSNTK